MLDFSLAFAAGASAFAAAGWGVGVVAARRAASWRREAARAQAALEAVRGQARAEDAKRRATMAAVTHEVRTPLAGLLGTADLLLETRLDAEQASFARAMRGSGEILLAIVDEILDHSRLEAGRTELRAEPFDPAALVESLVEVLAPRAQAKGLALAARVRTGVPARVSGDAGRVRQILLNVLGNAVKFTREGGVTLLLGPEGPERALAFTIDDTGPGLPPGRAEAIFEPFERGADAAEGGTGLGLAIARRLAEAMGGAIAAENRAGGGARFSVRLPLPVVEPAAEGTGPLVGLTVALDIDDPIEARALSERIGDLGGVAVAVAVPPPDAEAAPDVLVVEGGHGRARAGRAARDARARGVGRVLVLLSPAERRGFGPLTADASRGLFDGWLVRPVRTASLVARLVGGDVPDATPRVPKGSVSLRGAFEPASLPLLPPEGGLRVLLAEDDDVNALVALAHLRRIGARVVRVADGSSARDALISALDGREPPFDAALLDVRLPGLDGLGVARAVRAAEAERAAAGGCARRQTRLVAASANAASGDRAAARQAGFDAFLPKPLDPKRLAALLAGGPPQRRDDGAGEGASVRTRGSAA